MNICVIGTGYVGLVTGAVFAELGNDVICVDSAAEKIDLLNKNKIPFFEPGLEEMVVRNRNEERLSFTTDIARGVRASEIIFICVNTPTLDNGETDLAYIKSAARDIALALNGDKTIVNKSTVPVGTGDLVLETINEHKNEGFNVDVVSNPEFLREGSAIRDALSPDRIIIGASTKKVAFRLMELYATLEAPILITNLYTAEIIKYASNAFLATKISFINSIANLCEQTGADVEDVARGMGYDKRIGRDFLNAGLGFGGSCFPKDVKSLLSTSAGFGYRFDILKHVMETNNGRAAHFLELIKTRFPDLNGKTVAVLGLSFKPDTDDMREAKSIEIIKALLEESVIIQAYDPVAMQRAREMFPDIRYCRNAYEACDGADAMLLVTEWREFRLLNMEKIKNSMKHPIIFDGRNIYDPERKKRLGFEYYCFGRGKWPKSS